MKVALSLEVTDEQRSALAIDIDGKPVKRLATRDEVRSFLEGCVGSLAAVQPAAVAAEPARSVPTLTGDEEAVATKLRGEGRSEGYIRGYLSAGRK